MQGMLQNRIRGRKKGDFNLKKTSQCSTSYGMSWFVFVSIQSLLIRNSQNFTIIPLLLERNDLLQLHIMQYSHLMFKQSFKSLLPYVKYATVKLQNLTLFSQGFLHCLEHSAAGQGTPILLLYLPFVCRVSLRRPPLLFVSPVSLPSPGNSQDLFNEETENCFCKVCY